MFDYNYREKYDMVYIQWSPTESCKVLLETSILDVVLTQDKAFCSDIYSCLGKSSSIYKQKWAYIWQLETAGNWINNLNRTWTVEPVPDWPVHSNITPLILPLNSVSVF